MAEYYTPPPYEPDRGDCAPAAHVLARPARYSCLRCGHPWAGRAGPAWCPRCSGDRVLWMDREGGAT